MSDKRNFASANNDADDIDDQVNGMMQNYLQSQSKIQPDENEQSETQSVDINNNNKRAKRIRKQIDRYGLTEEEENYDSLFDQISAQTSSDKATDSCVSTEKSDDCTNSAILSQLTPGEQMLFKKLIEISTDVKVLMKTVVGMELRQEKAEAETHNLNLVDNALLLEIGLPLANEEKINDFNNKLKNKAFWSTVYNALKVIGGETGKGCGEQVTMAIFSIVFEESVQPKMTWTGKTNKKDTKKIALKSFTKITKLLTSLSQAADVKYTDALFAKTIVYKILKYAYRGSPSNNDHHCIDTTDVPVAIEDSTTYEVSTSPVVKSNKIASTQVIASNQTKPNQPSVTVTTTPHLYQMPFPYMHPMGSWASGNIWPQQNLMPATQMQNPK